MATTLPGPRRKVIHLSRAASAISPLRTPEWRSPCPDLTRASPTRCRFTTIRYMTDPTIRYNSIKSDTIRYNPIDPIQSDTIRYNPIQIGRIAGLHPPQSSIIRGNRIRTGAYRIRLDHTVSSCCATFSLIRIVDAVKSGIIRFLPI